MHYLTKHNFDMLPGKLASSELSFNGNNFQTCAKFGMESSAKTNHELLENPFLKTEPNKVVQTTCDSGYYYQDKNGSANLFPPMESENVNEVLKKIERYNQLKEAELCCEIQKAQIQVL